MPLKVVPIREAPSLQDIPAQLRNLAAAIEAGVHGEVHALFALLPREQAYPTVFGWGINDGACDPIIQFQLAHQWLMRCAAGLPLE